MTLNILNLGRQEYVKAWKRQKRLVTERAKNRRCDTLIFLEHDPVYTRGTSSRTLPLPVLDHPVLDVERGGDITYHGPGQLTGYPILDLKERGLLVGTYLRRLEQVLIDSVAGLGIEAERIPRCTGVWVRGQKLASIGVAVKGWISYHGFSINVRGALTPFAAIRPCGFHPHVMTTVSKLLGRDVPLEEMRVRVLESFERIFNREEAACIP